MSIHTTNFPDGEQVNSEDSGDSRHQSLSVEQTKTTPTPTLDTVFEILQNQRRRQVLEYLRETDGTVELREVARNIAAWENDKEVTLVTSKEYKRVYVSLYQSHLVKLSEHGIIDFDQHRGTIEARPPARQLYRYLEFKGSTDDKTVQRWGNRVIGIALIGFVLALGGLGIPMIPLGLSGFFLTTLLAVAVITVTITSMSLDSNGSTVSSSVVSPNDDES